MSRSSAHADARCSTCSHVRKRGSRSSSRGGLIRRTASSMTWSPLSGVAENLLHEGEGHLSLPRRLPRNAGHHVLDVRCPHLVDVQRHDPARCFAACISRSDVAGPTRCSNRPRQASKNSENMTRRASYSCPSCCRRSMSTLNRLASPSRANAFEQSRPEPSRQRTSQRLPSFAVVYVRMDATSKPRARADPRESA